MGYRCLCLFFGISLFFIFLSCQSKQASSTDKTSLEPKNIESIGSQSPAIKYAEGFSIYKKDGYREVIVHDLWNKPKAFQKYYLVPKENRLPEGIPPDVIVVRTPVESIAALSNTQIGILQFLRVQDKIIVVSLPDQIYDGELWKKARNGAIQGVGDMHHINFEKLVEMSPEIVMVSGFMTKSPLDNKLIKAGLPVVYNIDWMESSPLARAEWAKFIAAFFNKEAQAEQLFNDLETRYNKAKALVEHLDVGPSIISGYQYQGVWHMPGGRSYLGEILRDAKGNYCWLSDSTRGSIPLSFEVVYEKQANAGIWFGPAQCQSLQHLKNMDERYTLFTAFKTGNIFCPTKRLKHSGANDWWESGIMKPDIVLKDVIKILHPDVLPEHELYFYRKLK